MTTIHTLDLHLQDIPQAIAAYLVVGPEGPVLVECGPASTLPVLQAALAACGYRPADVGHVLVTHIHLDHAGAAGWLARQGARIYVHHLGAPHLEDPDRLLASAARIYGDQMDRLWGQTLPVRAARLTPVYDGDRIEAAGLTFIALDTPGHARHHHVFRLGDVAFAGDAAGVRIAGSAFIDLPAPPPEFDREAWKQTLARLRDEKFEAIYPTHFGRVDDVAAHLTEFEALLEEATAFVGRHLQDGRSRDEMVDLYVAWARGRAAAGGLSPEQFEPYAAANPHYMSVDGLLRYWRKRGL